LNPSWYAQFDSRKALNPRRNIVSRARVAQISVNIAALVGAVAFAVAAPFASSAMVSADDGGTSQPPPPPTTDGHGWIG